MSKAYVKCSSDQSGSTLRDRLQKPPARIQTLPQSNKGNRKDDGENTRRGNMGTHDGEWCEPRTAKIHKRASVPGAHGSLGVSHHRNC